FQIGELNLRRFDKLTLLVSCLIQRINFAVELVNFLVTLPAFLLDSMSRFELRQQSDLNLLNAFELSMLCLFLLLDFNRQPLLSFCALFGRRFGIGTRLNECAQPIVGAPNPSQVYFFAAPQLINLRVE